MGERFEATVGPVAHGGHCVVRAVVDPGAEPPATRVVFTRHCLPGERVVVEVTEGTDGDRFWRGDAVEILEPSPDRVPAPCPVAGPGLCGGCDFQHVDPAAQRDLKTSVVREQLVRLGGLDPSDPVVTGIRVEAVPGRDDGLRWRTRQRYATLPDGSPAMRRHRSHDLVGIDDCLIAADGARPGEPPPPAAPRAVTAGGATHEFALEPDGFWQVHPAAPAVLVETVLSLLEPRAGERVLDLYAGVGLFARFLADRVGDGARVVAVEADRRACRHAVDNLASHAGAEVVCGPTDQVLGTGLDEPVDLVVLDPPREGAKRRVVEQVVAREPRGVAYVACDPAALGRDVAIFREHGYEVRTVRAFDLFPMTHHVECVALLTPA